MKQIFIRKIKAVILVSAITVTSFITASYQQNAIITEAATIKISEKKLSLTVGQSKTLRITGTKQGIKWSVDNKEIATVTSKGKVTAQNAGSTIIMAKADGKKLKCKVTVKNRGVTEPNVKVVLNDHGVWSDSNTSYVILYIENQDSEPVYVSDSLIARHVSTYLNDGRLVNADTTTVMECGEDDILKAEYIKNTYDEEDGNYIKFSQDINDYITYTMYGVRKLDVLKSTIQFFVIKDNVRFTYLYDILRDKVQILNRVNDYYIEK